MLTCYKNIQKEDKMKKLEEKNGYEIKRFQPLTLFAIAALLACALPIQWEYKPQRIWVHTCTSDHPSALSFYQKYGFVAYKRAIEIADDPRLTGNVPREAASHVPIL